MSLNCSNLHRAIVRPFFLLVLALPGAVQAQSASVLILQGDSLLKADKPQRALEYYDKAVKAGPSADAYLARARAWYTLERMDDFLIDIEQALRLDSTSAEAHYQRGLYAFRGEDLGRAVYHSTKAVEFAGQPALRSKALILRGEARADLKRHAAAIEDLEAGLAGGIQDTEAMRTLAQLYDAAGRHADALKLLERLCELEPENVGHWTNRGFELIMLDRLDEALPMVEKALALDRDEPVALSNRAYIHLRSGREKEAWQDVERSLRAYPANPYALRTRAILRLRKGDREKACQDLTLAKALADIAEVDRLVQENCSTLPAPKRK